MAEWTRQPGECTDAAAREAVQPPGEPESQAAPSNPASPTDASSIATPRDIRRRLARRRFIAQVAVAGAGGTALGLWYVGCSPSKSSPALPDAVRRPEPVALPTPPRREPMIRVRIAARRPQADRRGGAPPETPITLRAESGWILIRAEGLGGDGLALQTPLTVDRRAGRWEISEPSGFRPRVDHDVRTVEFIPEGADPINVDGDPYPGSIALVAIDDEDERTGEAFDVVNHVALEAYLPGVLAKELFSHWQPQTFAAQAVAARSFACMEIEFNADRRHYDVTNTQASQAYVGVSRNPTALNAVQSTRGEVLEWSGALVPGYYSSCCGGIAASAVDAIGPNPVNDIPPLRSRSGPDACTEAPVYRWEARRPVDELTRRVVAWGKAHGNDAVAELQHVASIDVADVNTHGRPTRFVLRDDRNRTAEIPANRLRAAVDYDGERLPSVKRPLKSSFVFVRPESSAMLFRGHGFGHGVGLCQYGAQALARDGLGYHRILAMYYPEASVLRAYG